VRFGASLAGNQEPNKALLPTDGASEFIFVFIVLGSPSVAELNR